LPPVLKLAVQRDSELTATKRQFSPSNATITSDYLPVIRLSSVTVSCTVGGMLQQETCCYHSFRTKNWGTIIPPGS